MTEQSQSHNSDHNILTSQQSNANSDVDKRPQFGTRYLKEDDDVYQYNAWDSVEWDAKQQEAAEHIISSQLKAKMSLEEFKKIDTHADEYWNDFYSIHNNKFYKDRHWLFTEFPELRFESTDKEKIDEGSSKIIFEVGCGVGNTIFPILQQVLDSNIHSYCCDFSETAIQILKSNESYDSNRCSAFTYDITREDRELPFETNSVDIILMIYTLSSICPSKMKYVLRKLYEYLKPGGLLLFRDYGRYDLSQLRFKSGRCISDNFYARGEGTLVYFFDKEEVATMFQNSGYQVIQNICDRRLQVNRRKQLKMYRIWIQGKFQKPS